MRIRLNREEAQIEFEKLPPDEKELLYKIVAYCGDCKAKNICVGRKNVRDKFKCATDLVVRLMRIMDALEAEDHAFSNNKSPRIPFAFAALATDTMVAIGRTEQQFAAAFAKVAADERDRALAEFEPKLAALRGTIEDLSIRLDDSEAMQAELADELTEEKELAARLAENNAALIRENARMQDDLVAIEPELESLRAHAMALAKEILDVRTLNISFAGRENEIVQERDALKAEIKAKGDENFNLRKSNAELKQELIAASGRVKFAEASFQASERRNASEVATLVDAINSLASKISPDAHGHRPPPAHV